MDVNYKYHMNLNLHFYFNLIIVSLIPITFVAIPEILPAKGVSLSILMVWTTSTLISFIFPILNSAIKIEGFYFSIRSFF
jgi:hypothetical protein